MNNCGVKFAPTLRLLSASLLVSTSGGLKVYLASLLLGIEPQSRLCLSFSLLVYSVYTLDRALKPEEDAVNRKIGDAKIAPVIFLICFTFFMSAWIIKDITSPTVVIFPLFIGILYSKGIKVGKVFIKFKEGLGIKNVVVALTWGISLALFLIPFVEILPLLSVSLFFFLKSLINTIVYDFRDVNGDKLAGLTTLPLYLGEKETRLLLYFLHFVTHMILVMMVILGIIQFELILMSYSIIIGFLYILMYANLQAHSFRDTIVDGEWTTIALINGFTV